MADLWSNQTHHPICAIALFVLLGLAGGCASAPPDPMHYRLAGTGSGWEIAGTDRVFDDLAPRYPDFFDVVLEPGRSDDPPTGDLRDDMEKEPVDRSNYDALNSIAIGYFEMNHRGELARESGDVAFISAGFRAAKLVAVPWRAYMEIEDLALRTAIVEFFEDVATGEKRDTPRTMGRLAKIVESLTPKEPDPALRIRLELLTERLLASIPALPSAQ